MRPRLIQIVTPAERGTHGGNRVTALRWAGALRRLGHRVRLREHYRDEPCELLIALHAGKSHDSIVRYRQGRPDAPLIVALTGTDLYQELGRDGRVGDSIALASRLVILQARALTPLAPSDRQKARVIVQSASASLRPERVGEGFCVCVLAHVREVKDPLRAARAARTLPADSKISIVHAGRGLDSSLVAAIQREMVENSRYRWLGDIPRGRALAILAGSELLALTSLAEGGANVVSEALACGLPVVSSRIDGSIGLLGDDHPGYFEPGDTAGLAELLLRAEREPQFRAELAARSRELSALVAPARELDSWRSLLAELEEKGGSMAELRLTRLVQGGG